MSNFSFPPPPPPPPRREAPAAPQSGYPYSQPGRGRGYGSGQGVDRGGPPRPHGRGRAGYSGDGGRGGTYTGRSHAVNDRGAYSSQRGNNYGAPYGQSNGYGGPRNPSYRNAWNQAPRGSIAQPHGYGHDRADSLHSQSSGRPPSRDGQVQGAYPSPSLSGGPQPPRKRPFSTAFSQSTAARPQAAPAVPSFNAGIPSGLPTNPAEVAPVAQKIKKPRKHNQLGLTPVSQDHASSSEDENEETNLAAQMTLATNLLQFEYKGRTATLKTAAELAAWIAERKKRYPTAAKAEAAKKEAAEKKRRWAEEKKQREEAAKEKRLERERNQREQQELRRKLLESQKKQQDDQTQNESQTPQKDEQEQDRDGASQKARLKAEKLRRKAERAQIKAIKAEAAAQIARVRRTSLQANDGTRDKSDVEDSSVGHVDSAITSDGHDIASNTKSVTPVQDAEIQHLEKDITRNTADTEGKLNPPRDKAAELEEEHSDSLSISSSSSLSDSSALSDSDPDEQTSSAGSDSSADSDSDVPPEQTTTKRLHPDRVAPPPRRPIICRNLLKTGKCKFGAGCNFSHDIPPDQPKPQRADKRKPEGPGTGKERRKGLWQVMVEKELEEERKQVLRAVVFLGENGMLGED